MTRALPDVHGVRVVEFAHAVDRLVVMLAVEHLFFLNVAVLGVEPDPIGNHGRSFTSVSALPPETACPAGRRPP